MNYDRVPVKMCALPTCTKGAGGLGAWQNQSGRAYCSKECHDADPRRAEAPVPPPAAAPRPDVPEHHRPISVGALVRGSR